jgi:hypothetical protein
MSSFRSSATILDAPEDRSHLTRRLGASTLLFSPFSARSPCSVPKRILPFRPLKLNVDLEEAVCRMIKNAADTGGYATQRQVLNFTEAEFRKTLTYGWLDRFLHRRRHSHEVRRALLAPQELPPLQIPRSCLERYITLIKTWVPLVPAKLIFNLDETGLSDWEERKAKPVMIPTTIEDSHLHYPVDRGIRHQTLLCCISASGDAYCPLLVCSTPVTLGIFEEGFGMESICESKFSLRHP